MSSQPSRSPQESCEKDKQESVATVRARAIANVKVGVTSMIALITILGSQSVTIAVWSLVLLVYLAKLLLWLRNGHK